jgi:hypothetical protein
MGDVAVDRYAEVLGRLGSSESPIIRYKTQVYVHGRDPNSKPMRSLRDDIADSDIAKGLRADLEMSDPGERAGLNTIYLAIRYLADIDYPPGDASLEPYRDQVYEWLRRLEQQYDGPLFIRDKYRVHGSFHGNAIYASVVLGLVNDETEALCENLLRYQWPGGGWNCNKKPNTKGPTIVHTAFGMRGLVSYQSVKRSEAIAGAIYDSAQMLLARQVYLKRSNGEPLRPVYTKLSYPYPRLYDFMAGLHILTRAGYIADPRCERALDLLESKFVDGEGWPTERKLFHHNPSKEGFTNARWEDARIGAASEHLTVDALEILRAARRF